jgi:hypothetical protein
VGLIAFELTDDSISIYFVMNSNVKFNFFSFFFVINFVTVLHVSYFNLDDMARWIAFELTNTSI